MNKKLLVIKKNFFILHSYNFYKFWEHVIPKACQNSMTYNSVIPNKNWNRKELGNVILITETFALLTSGSEK